MKVRITRIRQDVELPAYATPGSVAFDLAATENLVIEPKNVALVPTGLVIATPPGYAMLIATRSSLFKKKGVRLANGVGVVDQDYCGPEDEIKIALWNPGDVAVNIAKGERLAQGFFVAIGKADWLEAPAESGSRGGFGSTGGYGK